VNFIQRHVESAVTNLTERSIARETTGAREGREASAAVSRRHLGMVDELRQAGLITAQEAFTITERIYQ
jgi:hypothetical protein